jgi:alkane 1-monooxygenase
MILLACLPGLYFRVMDPRLLAQAGGSLDRINLDPQRAAELRRRYGAAPSPN